MSSGRTASTSKVVISEDNNEIRDYEQCGCQIGCGSFKSKRLFCKIFNCCNNAKGALFFLCGVAFFQGFVINGLTNIVITTLEKRFNLASSETGFVAASYDIGVIISLVFVTYVGGRGHKPLWLGWGTLILGLGSVVFSLPHFVAPTYTVNKATTCVNVTSATCGEKNLRVYRGFFIVSQLLHGIGAAPLYTLALTYLDENVKQVYTSIYHGIFYAFSVIGPGIGYLVGGQFLAYYTNPGEAVKITPESVFWVGNWWSGFLIGGLGFIIFAIPLLMYPRQLPFTDKHRLNRGKEMYQDSDAVKIAGDEEFGKSIRDFPRCSLILLKNPTIIFLSLAAAMDAGLIAGIATFGPKYLESMFRITASDAAFISGLLAVISSALGQLVGGFIVSKFQLTIRKMLVFCTASSIVSTGCFFIFLIKCDNTPLAGVNLPFNGENEIKCDSTCGCSTNMYDPICGSDNITYLSFCDAECERINSTHFQNCGRVSDSSYINNSSYAHGRAGLCGQGECPGLILEACFVALGVFFVFLDSQPGLQASLRCVPFFQRSFAIGLQWLIIRLFGSVPMPIIMGRVLDSSCEVWEKQCDECGSCKVYNNDDLSRNFTIMIVVLKGASVVFCALAWITYKPVSSSLTNDTIFDTTLVSISGDVKDKEKQLNDGKSNSEEKEDLDSDSDSDTPTKL